MRSASPRTAFAAATSWRSSATTARASIGRSSPRNASAAPRCRSIRTSIAAELVFVLNHAEISVVIAEDQEQVDKILSLKAELPHLELVVYDDPRGLRHYADGGARNPSTEMQAAGREFGAVPPGLRRSRDRQRRSRRSRASHLHLRDHRRPKGVMLSHANLLSSAGVLSRRKTSAPPTSCSAICRWHGSATRCSRWC